MLYLERVRNYSWKSTFLPGNFLVENLDNFLVDILDIVDDLDNFDAVKTLVDTAKLEFAAQSCFDNSHGKDPSL